MGTSSANWRGVVHRSAGAVVGVGNSFHFGTYGIQTGAWAEISPSDAAAIKSASAQSDTATVNAVLASAWATDWTSTAAALSNAGAPAGVLPTACRDWFNNVSF